MTRLQFSPPVHPQPALDCAFMEEGEPEALDRSTPERLS